MHREFEARTISGIKVGEDEKKPVATAAVQEYSELELVEKEKNVGDTSCGVEEEGQSSSESVSSVTIVTPTSNSSIQPSSELSAGTIKKTGKGSISVMV